MTRKESGGLFKAFTGWIEKGRKGKNDFVIVQDSNPRSLEDAMEVARIAKGWVEKDGEPAHVENGTQIDSTNDKK